MSALGTSFIANDEVDLKSDTEFLSAFVGYIEWGTRLIVINSQLTENSMASK